MSRILALGIDADTNTWALAAVIISDDGTRTTLKTEILTADKKQPAEERLLQLYDALCHHLQVMQDWPSSTLPQVAGIEQPNYPRNALVQRLLVMAVSFARLALHRYGVRTYMVHNTSWKNELFEVFRLQEGEASKRTRMKRVDEKAAAKAAVLARYPDLEDDLPQDAYDAAGVALWLVAHPNGPETPKPAARRRTRDLTKKAKELAEKAIAAAVAESDHYPPRRRRLGAITAPRAER